MKNYFMDTPVYKMWIDYIDYSSPKMSFIVSQKKYAFRYLKCTREEIIKTYYRNEIELELVYAVENRFFYCRKFHSIRPEEQVWSTKPPIIQKVNDFAELQVEIEKWMQYLKDEL